MLSFTLKLHSAAKFTNLEVVSDAALLERSRNRILDGEVPTAEDLVAHIHTVAFLEHPGVFVANDRPVTEDFR